MIVEKKNLERNNGPSKKNVAKGDMCQGNKTVGRTLDLHVVNQG